MQKKYNPKKIEKKWQKKWDEGGIYNAEDFSKKPKYYCLIEFPYPSGAGLHAGHLRSHIAIDIVARKKRMSGYNVMYPIGWDAFGLPTENFAIKTKTHPAIVTKNNVKNFTRQIKSYGPSFDWSREVNTTDPAYYKWTQWIFLKLFNSFYDEKLNKARPIEELEIPKNLDELKKRNYIDDHRLAYEAEMSINWCPSCKIGLANEEVVNGECERCHAKAEKKTMKQWMLRITKYADRLIRDLDTVDYLDKIKTQQVNWIGRSEGAIVKFKVKTSKELSSEASELSSLEVFTTRPDTIFGCTYMVISPEHKLITNYRLLITNYHEVEKYIEQAKNKSDLDRTDLAKEKTGIELKGIKAINPASGEEIPIWVADYVLASYGTGAIMAVPAHDERDFEFAKKFDLPIKEVVKDEKYTEEMDKILFKSMVSLRNYLSEKNKIFILIGGYARDFYEKKNRTHSDFDIYITDDTVEEINNYCKNNNLIFEINTDLKFQFKDSYRAYSKINCVYFDIFILKKNNGIYFDNVINGKKFIWGDSSIFEQNKIREELFTMPNKKLLEKIYQHLAEGVKEAFVENGYAVNSGQFDGLPTQEFKKEITNWLSKNNLGKKAVNHKLRDWVFSRQHYWGEPIPIVKCKNCGNVPLEEKDLPLKLPNIKNYEPTDTGESPLANITKWVNIKCPVCKNNAKRETDTMPNWAGSSWYYLRYLDTKNNKEFASRKKIDYWMPVDLYNGGMEHTTLHLLYSRFWHKLLFDLGYVNTAEPYAKRRSHGMILAEDGQKMSKSRGNVVNPDDVIQKYGADTVRLYEMFMGPYGDAIPWSTTSLVGMNRFLERIWNLQTRIQTPQPPLSVGLPNFPLDKEGGEVKINKIENLAIDQFLHKTIKKVTEDIENLKFNTAISALMILLNEMSACGRSAEGKEKTNLSIIQYSKFLTLLSPFAPHIAEEIWEALGNKESIHLQKWPEYNPELAKEKEISLVIQINGKLREQIKVPADISETNAKKLALESEKIQKWIEGKEIRKVIFVKGKLVNIVI